MPVAIPNIQACVFDAYGTLFDVHTAVNAHASRIGEPAARLSALWRAKQLEYTWLRSLMRRHADLWQVTGDALDFALDSCGITDRELRRELMEAYLQLKCYPDVLDTLEKLTRAGMKTTILSNG